MAHINRKYIDTHWFIFIVKGIISLLFGWVALFSMNREFSYMIMLVGMFLLSMSIIEFINALYKAKKKTGWSAALSLAVVDAVVALALLFTINQDVTWHLVLVAAYSFIRGFCEIVSGFRTTVDPTDRFTWVLGGMCGCIMGLAILNSGEYFVRFFGAYLLTIGICSLVYGVHNHVQKQEDLEARREAAKSRSKKSRVAKKSK